MGIGNIAITGMQAAMSNMEVISNNIANANTIGFKKSSASFSDIFPAGGSGVQVGLGVGLSAVKQDFTSGGPVTTGNVTDLSINGDGFFIMKDAGTSAITYTRAGQFQISGNYLMNGNNRLQGFAAVSGAIPSGSTATDITINTSPIAASRTTLVTSQNLNLNSNDTTIAAAFNPALASTYNYKTTTNIYDSLGNQNTVSLYYVKNASNSWYVQVQANGTTIGTGTLTFSTSGALSTSTGLTGLSFAPSGGAASPQTFDISLAGSTQYASSDASNPFNVDGYPAGTYQSFTIDNSGNVNVKYSNGQTVLAGQVAIAKFRSPAGLQYDGKESWSQTIDSGAPSVSPTNSAANITSGSLELSNVDLSQEMVNLINAQNSFQASAQVEQVFTQVMQIVTKL